MDKPKETSLNQKPVRQYCRHEGYSTLAGQTYCYLTMRRIPVERCKGCRKFQREDNGACYGN